MSDRDAGIRWLEDMAEQMAEREESEAKPLPLTPPLERFDKHPEL